MTHEHTKQKNSDFINRPPIVVVMGHINHGKSSLLDYIRNANVTGKEAGGITQHIGAYEVGRAGKDGSERKITFLDTPGHEAFIGIRQRGTNVADIAVLVVSAEDGVKPQTLEALRHLREKKVPFVVAINKIDKPEANLEKTKQSLAENGVYIEGYGGDIPAVPVSAKTGQGITDLLDMILLMSDLEEFKASKDKKAEGFVIDTNLDSRRGQTATLLVKDGTLRKGEYIVVGDALAPTRIMENDRGDAVTYVEPGSPVRIIGWSKPANIGRPFIVAETKKEAEGLVEKAQEEERKNARKLPSAPKETSEAGKIFLPVVIKADTAGSLEAIEHELKKIAAATLPIRFLLKGIGVIGETDIKAALGTDSSLVIGFNVRINSDAGRYAEQNKIQVKTFEVIYKLLEWTEKEARARIPKTEVAEVVGAAKVLKVFSHEKDKQIIGGRVLSGLVKLGGMFNVIRRGEKIATGKIRSLEQQKVKADEVKKDTEFGALVESKMEIAPGDSIEVFITVMK